MKKLSAKNSIAIVFVLAFSLVVFFVWTTYSNIQQTTIENRRSKSDLQVLFALKDLQKDLHLVENLQASYIATSKDSLLTLYSRAINDFSADTAALQKIDLYDSAQATALVQLNNLIGGKINNSRELIALHNQEADSSKHAKTKEAQGKLITDSINQSVNVLEAKDSLLLAHSNTQIAKSSSDTAWLFLILTFIFLAILAFFFYIISNDLKKEQKASAKFRYQASLIDSISDAIIGTDEKFIITGWNKYAEEIYGYSTAEALGKSIRLLQLEIEHEHYNTSLSELQQIGYYQDEFAATTKNNTAIYISASVTTLQNNEGAITGYIAVHRNITERKKLEQQLKKFNSQLEQQVKEKTAELINIFERITDGFVALDSEFNFTYINNKAGEILGYKPVDMIGKNIWTGFPESVNTGFNEACLASLQNQQYKYFESYYAPLGIWIENYIYPSPDGVSVFFKDTTYKKEAELALKLSEHNYKQLIENLHSGVVVHKPDTSIVLCNQEASNLLGLSIEKLQGKDAANYEWNFISEEGKKISLADFPVMKVLKTKEPLNNYILGINKPNDGGKVWVLANAFPVWDASMRIKEVVVTFVDISEWKKVEEELKISEEKFRSLVENAPDIIISVDLQEKIQFINSVGGGYSKDQIIGSSVYNFVAQEYHSLVKEIHQQVIESKMPASYETVSLGLDGIERWFLTNVGPIFMDEKVAGIMLITKEISERKKAEEETKQREETLNKAQRIAKIGNWELNTRTNELTWSQEQYRIFELEKHSFPTLYEAYINKLQPANLSRVNEAVKKAVATGEGYTMEYELSCNDGSTKYILAISETIKDAEGKVIGLKGISQDITERKNAEQRLQKSFEQIELLAKLSKAVSHATMPGQIYELALEALMQTIVADKAALFLLDNSNHIQLVASKQLSEAYKILVSKHCHWVNDEKNIHPFFVEHIQAENSNPALSPLLFSEGIVSLGFIPLLHQGVLMGKFMVFFEQPRYFAEEEIQLMETIARDVAFAISEKKSALALISSREKYKLLFDNNPMPMWMLSLPERNFIDVNAAAINRYSYSKEEFLKMNVLDIRPAEDIVRFQKNYLVPLAGEKNQGIWNHRKKNGQVIKVEIIAHDINYEGSDVRLILANDVDEKLKAEERLQNSYKEIRQLATHLQNIREEERTNIAREIHDELGQQLTGLKMYIAWLSKKIQPQEDEIKNKFSSTMELIEDTVKSVRKISTELRPSMLDDLGLIAAMEWQSSEFEKRSGIQTEFINLTVNKLIPLKLNTGLFRIFQESLTNVARHANAKKIISTLEIKDGIISLTIADDGDGFIVEEIGSKKTLGLFGMKERSMVMGGNYEIKSEPGHGTTVSVKVPIAEQHV